MPKPLTHAQALAALRIAVGILFIIFGESKVSGREFIFGGELDRVIGSFVNEGHAYPLMVAPLQSLVVPHGLVIAFLVAYGELAIGLSLVSGVWVRAASIFGATYMAMLILSANYPGPNQPIWRYFGASLEHSVLLLCFLCFALSEPAAWTLTTSSWWKRRRTTQA